MHREGSICSIPYVNALRMHCILVNIHGIATETAHVLVDVNENKIKQTYVRQYIP
jgi:hypothetical protein